MLRNCACGRWLLDLARSFRPLLRYEVSLPTEGSVPIAYIEPRPKGRPEGSPIEDYVVESHADEVLATFKTQEEAIAWAKDRGYTPRVARVRNHNDKKIPDHWRAV